MIFSIRQESKGGEMPLWTDLDEIFPKPPFSLGAPSKAYALEGRFRRKSALKFIHPRGVCWYSLTADNNKLLTVE